MKSPLLENLKSDAAFSRYLERVASADDGRSRTIVIRFDADDDFTVSKAVDILDTMLPYILENVAIATFGGDD